MADEEIKQPVAETPAPVAETAAPVIVETPVETTILGSDPAVAPEQPELKLAQKPEEVKSEEKAAEVKEPEVKKDEKPVEVKKEEVKAEPKKEEAKPVEVKADEKPAETKPAPLPTFDPFVLPEGVKLEDSRVSEIQSMLGNFEVASKADHIQVQKFGQAIVEYGVAAVKEAVDAVQKQANDYWANKQKEYLEAFEKDPEIGGNRRDTTVAAANQFIRTHVGDTEQQKAFRKMLVDHKVDNHPLMIRALANANLARSEGSPLPATKPVPAPTSKLDKWYGNGSR